MVKRLKREGYWVRGVDIKRPDFSPTEANDFLDYDLTNPMLMQRAISFAGCQAQGFYNYARQFDKPFDEIYQFAADMGGAGYIFSGEHDADVMTNSALINLHLVNEVVKRKDEMSRIFYSSSACMYPAYNQEDPNVPNCEENSAYPAQPDSEYGWEKLFSERLYLSYARNYSLPVRIARYHNIYGPEGTYRGGREKAPAAACRKTLLDDPIVIWGDGKQTRSFLYIEDCIDATRLLMESDFTGPVNIGSEEMVTINQLFDIARAFENKGTHLKHDLSQPQGVRGRNSHNRLIEHELGWHPKWSLVDGMYETYTWIRQEIDLSDLNPNNYSFA